MSISAWVKTIAVIGGIAVLYAAYQAAYSAGYDSASLKRELEINKQAASFQKQRKAIEEEAFQAGQASAKQRDNVTKIYIPVEKEIIKYVSKPVNSTCDVDFVTDWVRIHNKAANPNQHTAATGRISNAPSTTGTGRN
ncbi:hypothetical protein C1S86_24345 [Vibrio parahaemolyticus]|uniref:hypothetical protein n=2 Tax=Vibrio parahaemolyticus TaxID=670 RepID=UPI000C87909A|nr:hypothetical protein [Vibrio parahaemolyticus]EJB8454805.1 hypothetical protein [Vibrio parahaemolyticus]PMT73887.1 hypothetical protein C1S97_25265 [Vibrio parahaemolyticus]PMT79087.1 hypothetical protein C1S86_24345 [Vibrio parahaemolyticus]